MNQRLVLVVSIWLNTDDIAAYQTFERKAGVVMAEHGGRIERVIRVVGSSDDPFEIHIVTFPDAAAFESYRSDPDAVSLASEREQVISRTEIKRGIDEQWIMRNEE